MQAPPSTQGKGAHDHAAYYPPASTPRGRGGHGDVQVCVRRTAACREVKVAKSSGFAELDEAAVKEVQRNWRFVPARKTASRSPMWHTFNVKFKLTD